MTATAIALTQYKRTDLILCSSLSRSEKFVLTALNRFLNKVHQCWPGEEKIAQLTSTSVTTVRRSVRALQRKGVINVATRRNGNRQGSNIYTVNFSKLTDFQAVNLNSSTESQPVILSSSAGHFDPSAGHFDSFEPVKMTGEVDQLTNPVRTHSIEEESGRSEGEGASLRTAKNSEQAIADSAPKSIPVNSGGSHGQEPKDSGLGFESKSSAAPPADDFEPTSLNYSDTRVAQLRREECHSAADYKAIAKRPKVLDHYGITEYWVGPGRNDFAEQLIQGAIRHLQGCPSGNATRVGAQDWIRGRLSMLRRDSDYETALSALEARYSAGKPLVGASAGETSSSDYEDPYGPEALNRLMSMNPSRLQGVA